MRAITGKPIKFIGVGEKIDDIEEFYPSRLAGRILGMGDIVSLVEKAKETIDSEKAEKIANKIAKGIFDLDDMSSQLQQMSKMGGISGLLGMLPGIGKIKKQMAEANLDDSVVKRQIAIISSMTPKERRSPKILNASRKKRIAKGSGSGVPEINKLVKLHRQTSDMMKKFGKRGMLNDNFGVGMSKDNANSLDKPLNLTDNMLADIGKSATKGLPGLPGLSDNKNKLSGLLNLTGRKK
jgi:signal recognition particle subunit SRP54